MTVQIELSPELERQVNFWAKKSNETPDELAIRLLEEYVDDCQDAHEFFSKEGIDDSCLYSSTDVKEYLGLES